MTADQFAALAQLLSLRVGPAQEAARLVLVENMRIADAARQAGCSPNSASNAVARCKKGIERAEAIASDPYHWMRGDQWTPEEIRKMLKSEQTETRLFLEKGPGLGLRRCKP